MPTRFRADGATGRVAIYECSDDLPWTDPVNYRSRTFFHSGLTYLARVATLTGTLSLPSGTGTGVISSFANVQYNLGAHGQSGTPMVEGKWIGIGTGGADVPMIGSLPVYRNDPGAAGYVWQWLTLCVDASNVYINEMYIDYYGRVAMSIPYEIHILNRVLS